MASTVRRSMRRRPAPGRRALVATAVAAVLTTTAAAPASAEPARPLPVAPHIVFYGSQTMTPSSNPLGLPRAVHGDIDASYTYAGRRTTVADFLERTSTRGLVVLHDGRMVAEKYWAGYTSGSRFNSWSVGKSITSTAVGLAFSEGRIDSLDDPITEYVPELKGSGYDGVPIEHILQMSSGQDYDESDYANVTAGATGTTIRMVAGEPLKNQARQSKRVRRSGTAFNYASMDTFVLGWLVTSVTGRSLPSYVQQKIWHPAGMASSAAVGEDYHGSPIAYASYHATTRDFARFGELFANGGEVRGRQVIPAEWVRRATTPQSGQVAPGKLYPGGGSRYGYGYQWWIGEGDRGDYTAIGILGQFVYVWPAKGIVIAKNSEDADAENHMEEAMSAFRAIADKVVQG
ncbi:MAG: serine hydrolase [Gordonia sp. (in: high G+C Gram-positive bacteria)]|uniref:serine hydrolase domain-containing protein n=1 Tax=Gordonia sp. (in: high G+C Gram-positive bacteria) TaxID=84139 RepID=UPI0039E387C8